MSSERSVPPNPTRDPRLANRALPTKSAPIDIPPRRPSTAHDDTSDDKFILRLSQLVQEAVQTCSLKSEREVLEKKKTTTEGLLRKAKNHSSFPSTTAFFHQTWTDEDARLTRVDGALKEHQSRYEALEKRLKENWNTTVSSSVSDEHLAQLKQEVETTKQAANKSKDESASLRQQNRSLEDTLRSLQGRMTILEKSVENHSASLVKQGKDNTSRFEQFSSELEKHLEGASSKLEESISTKLKTESVEWHQQRTSLGTEIETLHSAQQVLTGTVGQLTRVIGEQRQEVSNIKPLNQRLDVINARLDSLGTMKTASAVNNEQPSQVQSLEGMIGDLRQVHEMKDELQFSTMDEISKMLNGTTEELNDVKSSHKKLEEALKALQDGVPATGLKELAGLSGSLQTTQRLVDSIKVGLLSLETRYNSLTTEPLARNMVIAMQEMYPSAGQLIEQTSALRMQVDRELTLLKGSIETVGQNQHAFARQVQQDAALRLEELNRLRNDHSGLSQSLKPLWERYNAQGHSPNQEDLRKVQAEFNTLSAKLETYIANIDEQMDSKKKQDELLLKNIRGERDNLTGRVDNLAISVDKLVNEVEGMQTANTSNLNKVESHAGDIQLLRDGIHELKEATSNQHQTFLEQYQGMKESHGTHGTDIASLLERISELEHSEKTRYQELHEQLDKLREAVEAKVFPSGNASPDVVYVQPQLPKEESPTGPERTARIFSMAETNPTLALREKKRKKKRSRPSGLSEDERLLHRSASPRSFSSPASPLGIEGTPLDHSRRMKKKKKKRKIQSSTEPITLDD
ncbi:hypothetical protein BDV25DRAFT_128001 [Aspergillus avenaceus]|uniref:Paramyosin n=1 Tax=Aspergillus avenaceus TaxID=36643 RepID=A0A5N6U1M8_ASPAV|nr:hypothetical protein BDV25DRAFT_128001 [Aspergillus avenaceus]